MPVINAEKGKKFFNFVKQNGKSESLKNIYRRFIDDSKS
jgi:hypothetical protein